MSNEKVTKLLAEINKKYGKDTILPASKALSLVVDRLPFEVFDLDMKIGGGIPRGRVTVLKGEYSTGKSALTYKSASRAQRTCRFCGRVFELLSQDGEVLSLDCKCGKKEPMRVVVLDQEHSFDPTWVKKFNVRIEDLLVIETEFAEQAIDVVDNCIRSQQCDLLIVDSIAALTPMIEIKESSEKWQMGVMARLLGKAFRKWTSGMNSYGLNSDTKCTILMVNQLRLAIGGYKPVTVSPGGKAADFYQSLELRLKKESGIIEKGSGRPIGVNVEFLVKKNKTFPITGGGQFSLYFVAEKGKHSVGDTDTDAQVSRLAAYWGILKKSGAWIIFPDGTKAQGAKAAGVMLRENPKLLTHLMDLIKEKELAWQETGVTLDGPKREDSDEQDESDEPDDSEEAISDDVDD